MEIVLWSELDLATQNELLTRPTINNSQQIQQDVAEIINQVKTNGDARLIELTAKFDQYQLTELQLAPEELTNVGSNLSNELKAAMQIAANNIQKFHLAQKPTPIVVETMPGLICQQVTRPINAVGLYIPAGSAPLLSTVLMLAIPAKIAGCKRIVLASPPPIADEILYAAKICGINEIYQVGGAQAIAALAFGTESIAPVDKIFGPGNAYVTEAKQQVSQTINGAMIDMPAGPSEVLVIADSYANPSFIAADLLAQAEHGADSQVILLTPDITIAKATAIELKNQLEQLPRKNIILQALAHCRLIVTKDIFAAVAISNQYAPEHLIIQTEKPEILLDKINNAGSIFVGKWSPESVGDYASGTNHVLPTYGYCKTYSSLGVADFQKRMTIQTLTQQALINIAPTVEAMATAEQLIAHKQAVSIRVAALKQQGEADE